MSVNLDMMIAFEEGEVDEESTVELFQGLVDSGLAWQLQGFYGSGRAGRLGGLASSHHLAGWGTLIYPISY